MARKRGTISIPIVRRAASAMAKTIFFCVVFIFLVTDRNGDPIENRGQLPLIRPPFVTCRPPFITEVDPVLVTQPGALSTNPATGNGRKVSNTGKTHKEQLQFCNVSASPTSAWGRNSATSGEIALRVVDKPPMKARVSPARTVINLFITRFSFLVRLPYPDAIGAADDAIRLQ